MLACRGVLPEELAGLLAAVLAALRLMLGRGLRSRQLLLSFLMRLRALWARRAASQLLRPSLKSVSG